MIHSRSVALALILISSPALAQRAARLLPDEPPGTSLNGGQQSAIPGWAFEAGAGAVTTLIAVPASFALATWVGSLSGNLVLAALPGLLVFAVLPPLAMALVELSMIHLLETNRGRLFPALGVAWGAHVALMIGAILLGVSPANLLSVALLALVEAVVLPAVTTPLMRMPTRPMVAPVAFDDRRALSPSLTFSALAF